MCRLATRMQANIVQEYQRVELSPGGPKTRDRRSVSRRKKQKSRFHRRPSLEVLAPKRGFRGHAQGMCNRSIVYQSERSALELKSPVQVVFQETGAFPRPNRIVRTGAQRGFRGGRTRRILASPGVPPPFRRLHGTHDDDVLPMSSARRAKRERRDRMSGRSRNGGSRNIGTGSGRGRRDLPVRGEPAAFPGLPE